MAHLEAQVPEQVEHVLHDALAPGRLPVGEQEQQVHVGGGGQEPAPVAAGGDDGHMLGGRGVHGAVGLGHRVVVDDADQRVLEGREAFGAAPAAAVGDELVLRLRARRLEQVLEAAEHRRPRLVHPRGCAPAPPAPRSPRAGRNRGPWV